ncbi:MAG: hypothetical protein ACT4QC_21805 [Planctomycetaceae bacterium]
MSARYVHVAYSLDDRRWEATTFVRGSLYRICGRSPSATFQEMARLLQIPADRWRITRLAPNAFQCEHLPLDEVLTECPSTAENLGAQS